MEKLAGGDSPAGAAARPTNTLVEPAARRAVQRPEAKAAEVNEPSALSAAEVAAHVEKGRVDSLSSLEDVAEAIDEAVEVLNQALSLKSTSAIIQRDEELNRYLVTIKDKESGEIVRQIPDEALIKFARNLQELRGLLFDETT